MEFTLENLGNGATNGDECDKDCPYFTAETVDGCKIFAGCPFCQVVDALSKESAELGKKMMEVSK